VRAVAFVVGCEIRFRRAVGRTGALSKAVLSRDVASQVRVRRIDSGVDNGDPHAFAGEAELVRVGRLNHRPGVLQVRLHPQVVLNGSDFRHGRNRLAPCRIRPHGHGRHKRVNPRHSDGFARQLLQEPVADLTDSRGAVGVIQLIGELHRKVDNEWRRRVGVRCDGRGRSTGRKGGAIPGTGVRSCGIRRWRFTRRFGGTGSKRDGKNHGDRRAWQESGEKRLHEDSRRERSDAHAGGPCIACAKTRF